MNENELRHALRTTMATATQPPPMSELSVLDAARLAERRRRARWAGVGSAAAAVAVVGLAVVVVAATSGAGETDPGALRTPPTSTTTTSEQPTDTETSWPNGQTDRTANNGPEFDQGVALLEELDASVPAGYESPDDLLGTGDLAGAPMKDHQAQYDDTVGGVEVWEYMADAIVTKGNGYGRLLAEVTTPGNEATGEGCGLSPGLWGLEGGCSEVAIDGKRVGVFYSQNPELDQFDQWAGYRHNDGTVVWIAQAGFRAFTDFKPLPGPPLSDHRLAELAADPRFHLD